MKKSVLLLLSVLLLSACGSPTEESQKITKRFDANGTDIITDSKTGCKYLFYKDGYGGGLSPLYNDKGELYCGK